MASCPRLPYASLASCAEILISIKNCTPILVYFLFYSTLRFKTPIHQHWVKGFIHSLIMLVINRKFNFVILPSHQLLYGSLCAFCLAQESNPCSHIVEFEGKVNVKLVIYSRIERCMVFSEHVLRPGIGTPDFPALIPKVVPINQASHLEGAKVERRRILSIFHSRTGKIRDITCVCKSSP